jgi:hypothetical protein
MDIEKIKQAREGLHRLVQLVGAVPRSLLAPDPSDGSASLLWNDELKALVCQEVDAVKVGLLVGSQKLIIVKFDNILEIPVIDKTFEEVLEELKNTLSNLGLDGDKLKTELPYELPDSVVELGNPFRELDKKALESLSNLYSVTHTILKSAFSGDNSSSEIRCWPHHFDIATLLTVEEHEDPEKAKSIGFGFSPGDGGYEEPYFYLTPWPYPEMDKLYDLSAPAIWNTEGWVGAVLKANEVTSDTLEDSVTSFFNNGLIKLKPLL